MTESFKITIDKKVASAKPGDTILQAARSRGIEIPTLCAYGGIDPVGSCRVCLVELQPSGKLVTACSTPAEPDMVVVTDSPRVHDARRTCIELLMSEHNADCLPPCRLTCPAECDVQGYATLIAGGRDREALELIRRTIPFAGIMGRVCPHPCEQQCRRNRVDTPLSVCGLKRYVADREADSGDISLPGKARLTGKRVAVVGGGPAGLTAAYYLLLAGHDVTIFDQKDALGGMLRWGIPRYRLPAEVLDREIDIVGRLGAEVVLGSKLGRDFTLDSLDRQGFDAAFLALGAQVSTSMRLEGEDLPGVWKGLEFLDRVAHNSPPEIGRRVGVVGGGNVAFDAARSALRLGAESVTIIYRRGRDEMPANPIEVEAAEHEGVQFELLTNPVEIRRNDDALTVTCVRMELGEPDDSGRRRPQPIADSEVDMELDTLVSAIGQRIDSSGAEFRGLAKGKWNNIVVDEETFQTDVPWVFAGGDCVSGADLVVTAVAAGRKAAGSIDRFLHGQPVVGSGKPFSVVRGPLDEIDQSMFDRFEHIDREAMPEAETDTRRRDFQEVELGLSEEMARREATRCLSCGCQDVFSCRLRMLAVEYDVDPEAFRGSKRKYPIDDSHPYIVRDPNKCILCGCCQRVCTEVVGQDVIGFAGRGFDTDVTPPAEMPLGTTRCISCGACVDACPVGALSDKRPAGVPVTDMPSHETTCSYCGLGCRLDVQAHGDLIAAISAPTDRINETQVLCERGRYGYRFVNSSRRLRKPLVRPSKKDVAETGLESMTVTSWRKALDAAASRLKAVVDKHGPGSVGVVGSSRLTCEAAEALAGFAHLRLGSSEHIGTFADTGSTRILGRMYGSERSPGSTEEIASADVVLGYHEEVLEQTPGIVVEILKAKRNQAWFGMLGMPGERLTRKADLAVGLLDREARWGFIKGVVKLLVDEEMVDLEAVQSSTTGFDDMVASLEGFSDFDVDSARTVASKLASAHRPAIVALAEAATTKEMVWLTNLALVLGRLESLVFVRRVANLQGLIEAGYRKPGLDVLTNPEVKAAVIFGEDPITAGLTGEVLQAMDLVIVVDLFPTATTAFADIVLPLASVMESNGLYCDASGTRRQVVRVIEPVGEMTNDAIIEGLDHRLHELDFSDLPDARRHRPHEGPCRLLTLKDLRMRRASGDRGRHTTDEDPRKLNEPAAGYMDSQGRFFEADGVGQE